METSPIVNGATGMGSNVPRPRVRFRSLRTPRSNGTAAAGAVRQPKSAKGPVRTTGPTPQVVRRTRRLLVEGVLDLLAGLLDVGLALVALALGLEVLVVGGVAERLLGLAEHALALVGQLVVVTHVSSSWLPVSYPGSRRTMHPGRNRSSRSALEAPTAAGRGAAVA